MAKKQIDLGLTGLDELFMDDKERTESRLPKIHEIPLSEIDEFPNHPFHVRLDEDMDQLVESVKERKSRSFPETRPLSLWWKAICSAPPFCPAKRRFPTKCGWKL